MTALFDCQVVSHAERAAKGTISRIVLKVRLYAWLGMCTGIVVFAASLREGLILLVLVLHLVVC